MGPGEASSGTERVGFVGLGRMGQPMAARVLATGRPVACFDIRAEAREEMARRGAVACDSPAAVAAAADVVLLSLPDHHVVEAVLFGTDGLLAGGRPGLVVIDTSSAAPSSTRASAARLTERGIAFFDAPVSGGVARALTGELIVMVGAPEALFERFEPLLRALGTQILRVGDIGAGHTAKALNNLVSAATLLATAEAMVAGTKAGLDPALLLRAINGGSGRSNSSETKFPRYVLPGTFDSGFTVGLCAKDLGIAVGLAHELGVPMPCSSQAQQTWLLALAELGPEADQTAIIQVLERAAGVQVRSAGPV